MPDEISQSVKDAYKELYSPSVKQKAAGRKALGLAIAGTATSVPSVSAAAIIGKLMLSSILLSTLVVATWHLSSLPAPWTAPDRNSLPSDSPTQNRESLPPADQEEDDSPRLQEPATPEAEHAPLSKAKKAPVRWRAPRKAKGTPGLAEEAKSLKRIRYKLERINESEAAKRSVFRMLRMHLTRFKHGELQQEAHALQVSALCQTESPKQERALQNFQRNFPDSIHVRRLRSVCRK